MFYSVKEVADLTGITPRALRYYDSIALLVPKQRSEAGYRLYDEEDLKRLQQILFLKEMNFSLQKISVFLQAEKEEQILSLKAQRKGLYQYARRYLALEKLVGDTIEEMEGKVKMKKEERFAPFKENTIQELQKAYEAEVEKRWGDSEAYYTSQKRSKKYSPQQWKDIMEKQEENMKTLVDCFVKGLPVEHEKVRDMVEKNRKWIDENFYPCSYEMFINVAQMYVEDQRFRRTYEKQAEGLAHYYYSAITYHGKRA